MNTDYIIIPKFMTPLGPIERSPLFERSVWHDGCSLRANVINEVLVRQGMLPAKAAGQAIKFIVHEEAGLVFTPGSS